MDTDVLRQGIGKLDGVKEAGQTSEMPVVLPGGDADGKFPQGVYVDVIAILDR